MGVKAERRRQFLIELTVVCIVGATIWLTIYFGIERMPNTVISRDTSRVSILNHRLSGPDYLNISEGLVDDAYSVNKFGRSLNVDSGVDTDIWDGANATEDIDIWVGPTQARVHNIVSDDVADTAAGTGARTVRISGLTAWDAAEVHETVTLNGTTPVATTNSYVIIHRMKFMTTGSGGTNAGDIKATAVTDSTLTAVIVAGEGQTQMAIYGVPSTHNAFMTNYYMSAIKASSSLSVECSLLVNPIPDQQMAAFQIKHTIGLATEGSNYMNHQFYLPFKISGPAIIKLQGNSSSNNTDVSGGFDLVMQEV